MGGRRQLMIVLFAGVVFPPLGLLMSVCTAAYMAACMDVRDRCIDWPLSSVKW
jgi:hypothetical protein